jgi:hypothetical protein
MKEYLKKIANASAWILGVIVTLGALFTGAYFILGWHKKGGDIEGTGTITNPNSKLDKLHCDKIRDSLNSMWGYSGGNSQERDGGKDS